MHHNCTEIVNCVQYYNMHAFLGETILHLAAGCQNEKAGLFLVSNGANCSAVNERVSTVHVVTLMSHLRC